jgi:hypothetical protein
MALAVLVAGVVAGFTHAQDEDLVVIVGRLEADAGVGDAYRLFDTQRQVESYLQVLTKPPGPPGTA